METISQLVDIVLHVDKHLAQIFQNYGGWTYFILFAVVFCETGLVVTPFLPGDSLLFAAGALSGVGALELLPLLVLLSVAAILGDSVNYWVGRRVGPAVFTSGSRFFKQEHLLRAQEFYEKYGGKTIILARFVPIVRTFAPFVAGIGKMHYGRFWLYNTVGGLIWVWGFGCLGYFFGSMPIVKRNFSLVILAIIVLSVLPIVVEYWKARKERSGVPA